MPVRLPSYSYARSFKSFPSPQLQQIIQSTRRFHASRPSRLIDEAIHISYDVFQGIHTYSGLPWGLSIPLTAAIFRFGFFPVQYIVERNSRRGQFLAPLVQAWQAHAIAIEQKRQRDNRLEKDDAFRFVTKARRALKARQKALYRTFAHKPWLRFVELAFFPVWLANIDALRSMAGMNTRFSSRSQPEDGDEALDSSVAQKDGTPDLSIASQEPPPFEPDPSLVHEGVLWFQDLTVGDPTYALPLAVWGLMVFSYLRTQNRMGPRKVVTPDSTPLEKLGGAFRRLVSLYLLALGPILCINSPASAIMLYWGAGTAANIINAEILDRIFGKRTIIKPAIRQSARLKKKNPKGK